jgi:tetratricopeptide (TPR) repeat protein
MSTAATPRLTCPACHANASPTARECPRCGTDLSLLLVAAGQAADYYNQALRLVQSEPASPRAVELLRLAISIDPTQAQPHLVLGKLLAQQSEFEDAIACFQEALRLAPEGSHVADGARSALDKATQLLQQHQREEQIVRNRQKRRQQRRTAWLAAGCFALGALLVGAFLLSRGTPPPAPSKAVADDYLSGVLQRALQTLPDAFSGDRREDMLAAVRASHIAIQGRPDGGLTISGTVPTHETLELVKRIAAGMVTPPASVDSSRLAIADDYIEYTVQPGDSPQKIARHLCGSARYLPELKRFSASNASALGNAQRFPVGTVLRIPRRLLAAPR